MSTAVAYIVASEAAASSILSLQAAHILLRAAAVAGETEEPVFYVQLNTLPTLWASRPAPNGLSGADVWAVACEELSTYCINTLTVSLLEAVALLTLASPHPEWTAEGAYVSLTFRRMDTARAVDPCPLALASAAYESNVPNPNPLLEIF